MKFRTECEIDKSDLRLSADLPHVAVGSCFADNMTRKLRSCLVDAVNPLGVLFNPLSIARVVEIAIGCADEKEIEKSLFESNGIYHSWLFDSSFSSDSKAKTTDKIKQSLQKFREYLQRSKTLMITLGTAYCYFLSTRPEEVVANCHKQPQSEFSRRLVSVDQCADALAQMIQSVSSKVEGCRYIFTVSPVIHLRDGLHANNISKSTLLLAVDNVCEQFENCVYFPAYELVRDDLRDYRFYAADLCHPSDEGVEYVWEKFIDTFFDDKERCSLREGEALARRLAHRPIITEGDAYQRFMEDTKRMADEFYARHPSRLKL